MKTRVIIAGAALLVIALTAYWPRATPLQALKPGDQVGEMTLIKGAGAHDLEAPPLTAYCNDLPSRYPGTSITEPGVYMLDCEVPPLPRAAVGFGWVTPENDLCDVIWAVVNSELYLNGQPVDQPAFGTLDADVPIIGLTLGLGPIKTGKLRAWDVILKGLRPGTLTLRQVFHLKRSTSNGVFTYSAGTYDITYRITFVSSDHLFRSR